jgi:hypothetical protein
MDNKILYVEASKRDFVENFLRNNPGYFIRPEDGRIDTEQRVYADPPWIYCKAHPGHECHFDHKILFNILFKTNKIPSNCLNCWKVVVAPRNLRELMAMVLLQRQLYIPSKAGSEFERPNSPRMYGAYFYSNGYEEGHKCFNMIQEQFAKQKTYTGKICEVDIEATLEDDIGERTILKRACTEFEQNVGSSDTWDDLVTPEQIEYEEMTRDCFVTDRTRHTQSEHQVAHIINYWIHKAYQLGDETYKDYTDGRELFVPCKTYHNEPLDFWKKREQEKICAEVT